MSNKTSPFKAISITTALTIIISITAGTQLVNLAIANPTYERRHMDPPLITVHSPINQTYANTVLLNFTIKPPASWYYQQLISAYYKVDGKYNSVQGSEHNNLSSPFNYYVRLTSLSDGIHTVIVYADATGLIYDWISSSKPRLDPVSSETIYFTVDSTPPEVAFLSVKAKYETPEFPLDFTVNELVSKMWYVLDSDKNVTVSGNVTLSALAEGPHNVTVYAEDTVGNVGSSETITFTVAQPEAFPAAPIAAASVASVAVAGFGLLFYFRRRKRQVVVAS